MSRFKWLLVTAGLCCAAAMQMARERQTSWWRRPSSEAFVLPANIALPRDAVVPAEEIQCFKKSDYVRRELRGVWIASVDSDALNSPENIDRALTRIVDMHLNTVFPVVWNKGAVFFNAPRSTEVIGESPYMPDALRGRDVLADVVQSARARGVRVVPWFEYGLKVPSNMPIVRDHPEWFLRDSAQSLERDVGPFKVAYLSPFHPEAQDFLIRFFTSALDNYDIDAIQLDDHFSIPAEFGYDDATVALYRAEHAGQAPPANPYDDEWTRWRATKFTAFVARLSAAVHARGKRLSLAPNLYNYAYATSLQNWIAWALRGYVDEIVMQVYRRDLSSLESELNKDYVRVVANCTPFSVGVLAGVAGSPLNTIDLIKQQARAALAGERKLDGVSLFHYTFITDGAPSPVAIALGLQEIFSLRP